LTVRVICPRHATMYPPPSVVSPSRGVRTCPRCQLIARHLEKTLVPPVEAPRAVCSRHRRRIVNGERPRYSQGSHLNPDSPDPDQSAYIRARHPATRCEQETTLAARPITAHEAPPHEQQHRRNFVKSRTTWLRQSCEWHHAARSAGRRGIRSNRGASFPRAPLSRSRLDVAKSCQRERPCYSLTSLLRHPDVSR
jgi:hypothetical protein